MGDAGERAESVAGPDHKYTAFQKWEYQSVILPTEHEQFWRDIADSYFNACLPLIAALAAGHLNEDVEGTAAIFLFRHYLELMLKRIIWAGRQLNDHAPLLWKLDDDVRSLTSTGFVLKAQSATL